MPKICMNCKFADTTERSSYSVEYIICNLTEKMHRYDYRCKKWRKME